MIRIPALPVIGVFWAVMRLLVEEPGECTRLPAAAATAVIATASLAAPPPIATRGLRSVGRASERAAPAWNAIRTMRVDQPMPDRSGAVQGQQYGRPQPDP
ncbi:MAG: hypothetical protein M3Q88_01780 [Pseudomonadota bacterium]|nr:hypothetical protein [Pseudomonadota bacterium]